MNKRLHAKLYEQEAACKVLEADAQADLSLRWVHW